MEKLTVEKDIKKNLENPILEVVKSDSISEVIAGSKVMEKLPENQISPDLELYEKQLITMKKPE